MNIASSIKINSDSRCSFNFSINNGKYNSFFNIENPFVYDKNDWYDLYDSIENDQPYILRFRYRHECSFIESVGILNNNIVRFNVNPFGDQDIGFDTNIPMLIYKDDLLKALSSLLENEVINKFWDM